MFWRVALAFIGVATTMAVAAPNAIKDLTQWSDPVVIAETSVPARPALLATSKGVLAFWLDRGEGGVELRRTLLDPSGVSRSPSSTLARGADSQFGWPVAAAGENGVFVAWMARGAETVQLMGALLNDAGEIVVAPHPLAPLADEAGTLAILESRGWFHLAWSQFDHGDRRVWYLRIASSGQADLPARPVALGEAPTLVPGASVRLLWWQSTGFDSFKLMVTQVDANGITTAQSLTPPILQGRVTPALGVVGPEGLDVLVPIVDRGFSTRERLYHVRLLERGPTPREAVPGMPPVSEVSGTLSEGKPLFAWTTQAGRTGRLAVYVAQFDPRGQEVDRLTRVNYTVEGARFPAIVEGSSGFDAAWLQVTGLVHFRLVVATTQNGRLRRFAFGIPELDLSHPLQAVLFVGTVGLTIVPYAIVYATGFSLIALALSGLLLALLGSFAWKDQPTIRPGARLLLFLLVALALEALSRVIIPGDPDIWLLVGALAIPGGAIVIGAERYHWPPLQYWALAALAILVQLVVVLLPWGALQMSQF